MAATSMDALTVRNLSLVSSGCNSPQYRSQYVPLKSACKNEVYLMLLKQMSFLQRQIAQHIAATPTKIILRLFESKFESQLPAMWLVDLGGVRPVAVSTTLQIFFA